MSFEWPVLLLSLLLVPLGLAGYLLLQRRRMRYAARFTNLDLLANVVERSPGWRRHLPPTLALLALAALLTGVARPQATIEVPREQAGVVLALDVSGSMTASDVAPSRLEAARSAAEAFLDELPEDVRVGIVAFASEAHVLARPTDDRDLVRTALDSLRAEGGTAIGDAIVRSVELARGESARDGASEDAGADDEAAPPFSVLLLSDGANTDGVEPLEAADQASAAGVPVYTVALGTADGTVELPDENGVLQTIPVPPDPETLVRIAEETGGRSFSAPSGDELRAVYEEIGSQVGFEEEEREVTFAFAAAGGALLLVAASLSALWFNRIP